MYQYTNITTAEALFGAIKDSLDCEGLMNGAELADKPVAVLVEGNGTGKAYITVLDKGDLAQYDEAQTADLRAYGYGICNSVDDIRAYARDCIETCVSIFGPGSPVKSILMGMEVGDTRVFRIEVRDSVLATISRIKVEKPELNWKSEMNKAERTVKVERTA